MLFAVKMFQPISDFWTRHSDPGASRLPLLRGGPWEMMAITASYLYFVLYLGPRFMKHRKPYDLRFAMLLHNVLLVIFNCWLFSYGMWLSDWGKPIFECRPINLITASDHDRAMFQVCYLYFISKFVDYLDTIFLVLRKKTNHITFLHVFHHTITPILCYVGFKFYPHTNAGIVPLMNSFVHTVMYIYYALAALGPQMKKYLKWKKYITLVQLLQFTLGILHGMYFLLKPDCTWPKLFSILQVFQASMFFCQFYSFYKVAYGPNVKSKGQ